MRETADFDLKEFWKENDVCMRSMTVHDQNARMTRVPIDFWLDDHFLIEALTPPSTVRYYEDFEYRRALNRTMNDTTETAIGKRFFNEDPVETPAPNRFEVLMGSFWKLTEGGTPWLESTVETIDDVKRLNERNAKLDMNKAAFPEGWNEKKQAHERTTGKRLSLGGNFSRGPATMATSILGTTNACMFVMMEPEVMDEFFTILADRLIAYQRALMADTGNTKTEGYQFNDDNCYLFPPAHYERFCAPVLAKVFAEFAPSPAHTRFQHSDSAMGHLMGILRNLGVNRVNFGPTLDPLDIRTAMPDAIIQGQIPPFTLRDGTADEIIAIVKRDFDAVGHDGKLIECPAGSVAGGTPLKNLLTYMKAVHIYCRY